MKATLRTMSQLSNFFKTITISSLILLQITASWAIKGGESIDIEKVPFIVQIYNQGTFFCGGVLISKYFVLSAAHCFEKLKAEKLTVKTLASKILDGGIKYKVREIISPPDYVEHKDMDVALLKLKRATTITPVRMITGGFSNGDVLTVYGWGRTKYENKFSTNNLLTATVQVVDREQCVNMYRGVAQGIKIDAFFCAAAPSVDCCQGDSGGPIMFNGELCGIISFGAQCGLPAYPGFYTDLTSTRVRDFIKDRTGICY